MLVRLPLNLPQLRQIVEELRATLVGGHVQNVWDERDHAWVLKIRNPGRNDFLLLSTRPRFARVHWIEKRSSAPAAPGGFCQILRSRLRSVRFSTVEVVGDDRIVELTFAGRRSTRLVVHLFGPNPEILVLAESGRIEASSLESCGGASRYAIGSEYSAPRAARDDSDEWTGFDYDENDDDPLRLNRLVAACAETIERDTLFREGKKEVAIRIERELKRRRRTREKTSADLESCRSRKRDRELGELLKGSFGQLRRGLEQIELVDYFDPAMPTIAIELDPRMDAEENIARYFKRHRKAKRGIPILEERLAFLEAQEGELEALSQELAECHDLEALDQLRSRVEPLLRRGRRAQGQRGGSRKLDESRAGPRRFISADGFEILVGRSAKQNDDLTLKKARGNDVFLHVSGKPGAHVIIRTVPGKSVPTQTLLDAAQLAIYYSLPARSGGVLVEGATADVDYAPVKRVHKPKGAAPGSVLLASHKSLRVKLEREVIERLRESGGRD